MRIIKLAISILFILSLLSCASSNGPLFVHEPTLIDSDPCLYIYRPDSTYLQAAKWEFLIDKTNYVTLTNGTYAKIPIAPGRHEVVSGMSNKIGQPPLRITMEAVKGKNVYVKYEIQMESNVVMSLIDKPKFNNKLSEVEESQALLDLKNLRLTTVSGRSN
jgi:hypothetical protein